MRSLCWLLVAAGAAFGQIDPDTITIVSRSSAAAVSPDTVNYDVGLTVAAGKGLDEVLKVLAGVGATERDLTGVSAGSSLCDPLSGRCSPALNWSFRFSLPLAKLPETLMALAQASAAGVNIFYSAASGGLSPAPECAHATLISQARRHAESLAAAVGLRVGRVTAMSDAPDDPAVAALSVVRIGDFSPSTGAGFVSFLLGPPQPYIPPAACAVAVQFQLLR